MRSYVAKVILCLLVILSSESTLPVLAASDSSEQSVTTESSTTSKGCRISKAARDAINSATDAAIKNGKISTEALDLIDQAEKAAASPVCDNDKAVKLANQAIEKATTRFSAEERPPETDCDISESVREAIDVATEAWMKAGNVPEALELILQAEAATKHPDCDNAKALELAGRAQQWAECNVSEAALAINRAKIAVKRDGKISTEALDLIDQAETAATPPECDSAKAITLANWAIDLFRIKFPDKAKEPDEKDSTTPKSSTVRYKKAPFEMFPNCDFVGHLKEGIITGGPLIWISSPIITIVALPYYISSKTSGTSGCEKVAYIKLQQHRFATIAKDNLVKDMANGNGEYVTAMAYLHGCPTSTYTHYAKVTQTHFADIFPQPETDPKGILTNLEFQIAHDQFLSESCKWAS